MKAKQTLMASWSLRHAHISFNRALSSPIHVLIRTIVSLIVVSERCVPVCIWPDSSISSYRWSVDRISIQSSTKSLTVAMRFFPLALQQSYRNEIETASPASRLINFKLRRYLTHAAPVTSFEVPEAIRAALDKAGVA